MRIGLKSRTWVLTIGVALLGVALASPSARGAEPTVGQGGQTRIQTQGPAQTAAQAPAQGVGEYSASDLQKFPWLDSSKYQECGMDCVYGQGNKYVTLEAAYIIQKIRMLKDSDDPDEAVRKNLVGFCMTGEGAQECIDRYVEIQVRALYEARSAIVKNNDSQGQLQKRGADGQKVPQLVTVSDAEFKRQKALKPIPQDVPTLDALVKQNESNEANLQALVSDRYREWQSGVKAEPNRDDFVLFKEIPRDPGVSNGELLKIVETNPDGTVKIDEKAYKRAVASWTYQGGKLSKPVMKEMAKHKPAAETLSTKPGAIGDLSKEAYHYARAQIVATLNDKMKEAGVSTEGKLTTELLTGRPAAARTPSATASGSSKAVATQPGIKQQINFAPSSYKPTGKEEVAKVPDGVEVPLFHVSFEPNDLLRTTEDLRDEDAIKQAIQAQ